jgi:hypothetical protein
MSVLIIIIIGALVLDMMGSVQGQRIMYFHGHYLRFRHGPIHILRRLTNEMLATTMWPAEKITGKMNNQITEKYPYNCNIHQNVLGPYGGRAVTQNVMMLG